MTTEPAGTYLDRSTPGVYITEIDAFGSPIVGVPTAVPVFVGHTEFAGDSISGAALYNRPVAIGSLGEYTRFFGGPPPRRYRIDPLPVPVPPGVTPDFTAYATSPNAGGGWEVASAGYRLSPVEAETFLLYRQMQLFYENGGGDCFVVSAGSYWADQFPARAPDPAGWEPGAATAAALCAGLTAAGIAKGATMTVVPEACQLDAAGYAEVAATMLAQAGTLQDRMAILDLPGCLGATTLAGLEAGQAQLWTALATQAASLSYGAAYAPAVATTLALWDDADFTSLALADNSLINNLLTTQACQTVEPDQLAGVQAMIAAAFPLPPNLPVQNTPQYSGETGGQWSVGMDPGPLHGALTHALPLYTQLLRLIANDINLQPVSGALAGIWTQTDLRGVWTAPANIALSSVTGPLYAMNDDQQGAFNVPVNGMAIDIIRGQINRGTIVWGARTLDGNSNDYRYIQVRRTLIYIEQSIKAALNQYVFAANDATTWATVTAAISGFLTGLWQQGGLMGAKASDAYSVSCGLGSTMTSQNILDGYMIVAVSLQMIHPAEFIELTFTQQMTG